MNLTLDHVPFAWHDLDEITAEFDRLGLSTEYGGAHDNGTTHMAILGFEDYTYVELIAEHSKGEHDFWPNHIQADAGPAAWCIRVPEIITECKHVLNRGITVYGPISGSREREDGTSVEWDRAVFGSEDTQLLLPFAIQDRTPLSYRVTPSESVVGGSLKGVEQVVLAVENIDSVIQQFQNLYRFPQPIRKSVSGLGTVASFPGQPVALVTPDSKGWIQNRLKQLPQCPCTCLLGTDNLDKAREEYPLRSPKSWPDGRIAFFDSELLDYHLGVVERS
ncbi:VOC family protein [Haladaptatus sp. NG-SE-30]